MPVRLPFPEPLSLSCQGEDRYRPGSTLGLFVVALIKDELVPLDLDDLSRRRLTSASRVGRRKVVISYRHFHTPSSVSVGRGGF